MNPVFNPAPSYAFCTEQLDVFTFMHASGFCAIVFEEVQGFLANTDNDTLAQFGSYVFVKSGGLHYESVESVPELVARYADMKKRRGELAVAQRVLAPPAAVSSTWKK